MAEKIRLVEVKNAFRFGNIDPVPGEERHELMPYTKRNGKFSTTYYVAELTAYRTPQNTPMVLECGEATQGIMELFPVKIRCEIQYLLKDGVGLYYEFYAASLKGWRERDIAVPQLIRSFRSMP